MGGGGGVWKRGGVDELVEFLPYFFTSVVKSGRNSTIYIKSVNLYHSLGKFSKRQIYIFLIFLRKQALTFTQIVSSGDDFSEKKKKKKKKKKSVF